MEVIYRIFVLPKLKTIMESNDSVLRIRIRDPVPFDPWTRIRDPE